MGIGQAIFDILILIVGAGGVLTLFLKNRHEKKIKELENQDKHDSGTTDIFLKESEQVTMLINAILKDNEAWKKSYECIKNKLDASRVQMKELHKEITDLTKQIKELEVEAAKQDKVGGKQ